MTATFINQSQFDDIDRCMSFIETMKRTVGEFTHAAELGPGYGVTQPPTVEMNAGENQARLWKLKTEPGFYQFMGKNIEELVLLSQYLDPYISAMSPVEKRRPPSHLNDVSFPCALYPAWGTEPITDCFGLLQYHRKWLLGFSELFRTGVSGHEANREAICNVLPRVFDFMSVHLQVANARQPKPVRLKSADNIWRSTRGHYFSGMGATANLLAQFQRTNYLLAQACESFADMENAATLARLAAGMRLMVAELKQVQQFSEELVALRTGQ